MGRKKKEKPKPYQLELNEEVTYIGGLYDDFRNKNGRVLSRSKEKKTVEWYRIKFEDGREILSPLSTLKRKED